jgi:hypothetical protein
MTILAILCGLNIALGFMIRPWIRWINLAVGFLILAIIGSNAIAGCYPWSPKTVIFHQGMTICPGQTTTILPPTSAI